VIHAVAFATSYNIILGVRYYWKVLDTLYDICPVIDDNLDA
jgi:hypothetical protein